MNLIAVGDNYKFWQYDLISQQVVGYSTLKKVNRLEGTLFNKLTLVEIKATYLTNLITLFNKMS
jgi:hypothetical protein